MPDCPLNHVSSYVSVTSMPRTLILVACNCLSPHTDTIYADVSDSNTLRVLILVRIAPLYGYWYVITSQYYSTRRTCCFTRLALLVVAIEYSLVGRRFFAVPAITKNEGRYRGGRHIRDPPSPL